MATEKPITDNKKGAGRKCTYNCPAVILTTRIPKHLKPEILRYISNISKDFLTKKE